MTSSLARSVRSTGICILLLAAVLFTAPREATGQVWFQTARVLTPIEKKPTQAFLDTLLSVMERKEIKAKRSPDASEKMSIPALRDELIDEAGISLASANHVFIDYRFLIDNGGDFKQEITRIHFVFRPSPQQSDLSLLYIDAREPWVKKLIHQKGTSLPTNEVALIPFYRYISFSNLARKETTRVVEIAGETVRDRFDDQKQDLIRKVEWLMYETFV